MSWKWASHRSTALSEEDRREYKQVLSQVKFNMKQHNARVGLVLTDTELVTIKKLDGNGNLLVAQYISWEDSSSSRDLADTPSKTHLEGHHHVERHQGEVQSWLSLQKHKPVNL
ncbi:hypothetical protein ACO22_00177 [Paracoccidioides brasiliensis]|uniref:Uncharacterized protein n=1 Tax=Paracoccidioides brasiliensis TaxID=121759 RepID=A0A1D2JPZ6_PARBR|nr:hypothetical protein ACO22_00177 [Paracoccidioides brasiliensis]